MSNYSIWVCEYAYVEHYPESGIVYGAHNAGYRKLPYCYAVVVSDDHVAMVDVGYNHKEYGKVLADRFGVTNWHSPRHVLKKCGLTPEDVDTVFVTHCHFDHFGNAGDFPNATFYVQRREIEQWVWASSLPDRMRWIMTGVDPGDIVEAVELASQGRLVMIDGDATDVLPGIDLRAAYDTHTFGSMYVHLRNDNRSDSQDTWILAGDLVYVYDNIEGDGSAVDRDTVYVPVGMAQGSQTNLVVATEQMMKRVGYDKRRVIPVHEERLADMFPSEVDDAGLRISEICRQDGTASAIRPDAAAPQRSDAGLYQIDANMMSTGFQLTNRGANHE